MITLPQTRIIHDLGAFRVEALVGADEHERARLILLQEAPVFSDGTIFLYSRNWLHLFSGDIRKPAFPRHAPEIYEAVIIFNRRGECELRLHDSNNHTPFRVNGRYLSLSSCPACPLSHGDMLQIGTDIFLRYESLVNFQKLTA